MRSVITQLRFCGVVLPLRSLFGLFLVPVWCVLRLGMAAQFPGAKYLPFGYYVRARKRTGA